jgi:hypothetical protein
MHWKRSQEGYLLVDHRNSPGITERDLTPALRAAGFEAHTGVFESPTIRCAHCGTMVVINPQRTRARHYCQPCDHYVCDQANCILHCTPFIKTVDLSVEAAIRHLNIKEL